MAPNRIPEFPYQLAEYLEQSRRTWMTSSIYLGGTSGSGGGAGGPPGGFVGQLVQTRIAYDQSELSLATTGSLPSLLDNLNHIRYLITTGSFGGGGSGTLTGSGVAGRVAYWTSGSALGSDPDFTWNETTNRLGIGSLVQTSGSLSMASRVLTLDASMELDPTGASIGQFLSYNGSKWVPTSGSLTSGSVSGIPSDGWVVAPETFTYDSADSPTFTFTVPGDATSRYQPGMRIKLTQTTVKYFIITKVSSSTITIYGGTDYTLVNAVITSPYYSPVKSPFGFPGSPSKWTVTLTSGSIFTQASPTADTVYNLGTLSISIPIGAWLVDIQILIDFDKAAGGAVFGKAGLSTANNSFSDLALIGGSWAPDASAPRSIAQINRSKMLDLAAKTVYYLVTSVNANSTNLSFRGDLATTVARAICGYL